jgi:hypothetical protein
VGFLKFLKRGKKEEMPLDESLDAPPPPPSIKESLSDDLAKGLPEHPPELKEKTAVPKKEPPSAAFEEKLPELPKDETGLEVPHLPPLEESPKFVPQPPVEEPPISTPLLKEEAPIKHEEAAKEFHEKMEEGALREERKLLRERATIREPLYIRLDKFSESLRNISLIKGDLKKSDEILFNLIKSKDDNDKEFERWRASMEDIQKKFIFIEKTLFKGD